MHGSLQAFNSDEEEDEFEELASFVATKEQKIEYVRAAARRKVEATGFEVPLLLDPKKILEYIEIWVVKPDTPLDDLDIPKNIKFYVQQFLINEIHHRDLKTQLSKQLAKVHRVFRKRPVASVTQDEFAAYQAEVQRLTAEYEAKCAYIGKTKERMSRQMANMLKLHQPQASVPPTASTPQTDQTESLAQSLKRRSETDPPSTPQLPRSLWLKHKMKNRLMPGPYLLLLLPQEHLKHLQHLLLLHFLRKILSAGWLCSLHRPRHLLQRLPPRSFQRLYLRFLNSSLKLKKWTKMWILVTWAPLKWLMTHMSWNT